MTLTGGKNTLPENPAAMVATPDSIARKSRKKNRAVDAEYRPTLQHIQSNRIYNDGTFVELSPAGLTVQFIGSGTYLQQIAFGYPYMKCAD